MLLREKTYDVNPHHQDEKGRLYLEGVMMQAGIKNQNGRIYPKDHIQRAVDTINEQAEKGHFILGECDHPSRTEVHLSEVSHKLTEAKMSGNDAICKAEILDTPKGEIVKSLVESGVKVGASSRGTGSVNESTGEVTHFNFKTIDIVMNSSAPDAYPQSIREAIEMYRNSEDLNKLAEAVRYDSAAQKYFEKEMKRFIESIFE